MGTVRGISSSLFGNVRWAVLSVLYGRPDESFYLRQIVRCLGMGLGGVQRELTALTKAGIIQRRIEGKQVYFQANPECPIYAELKSIVVKTAGVSEALHEVLAPLASRILVSFIFGSVARSEQTSSSDVDLMVIGTATFAEVTKALRSAEEKIGREINPVVYSVEEFHSKATKRTSFLTEVLSEPKVFIIGGERELKAVA